jgi:hypothetical protein
MNNKTKNIYKWSNPAQVRRRAVAWLGNNAQIKLSTKRDKKYMVLAPTNQNKTRKGREKWVHFGQMGYEDFTKHKDTQRRKNYLQRSTHIRGNWAQDKYSPNNLSIHLLW